MSHFENGEEDQPIDAAVEQLLLTALVPVQPDPACRTRMLDRIEARIRRQPPGAFVTVRGGDGDWQEIAPRVYRKLLIRDDRLHACLYRMEAGSAFPAHEHPSDEECVCLEGEVSLGGIAIKAGDFHLAPQGLPHGEITTQTGCVLYIRCGGVPAAG